MLWVIIIMPLLCSYVRIFLYVLSLHLPEGSWIILIKFVTRDLKQVTNWSVAESEYYIIQISMTTTRHAPETFLFIAVPFSVYQVTIVLGISPPISFAWSLPDMRSSDSNLSIITTFVHIFAMIKSCFSVRNMKRKTLLLTNYAHHHCIAESN
jgi:hypothetical protein